MKADRWCDCQCGSAQPSATCPADLKVTCGKAGPDGVAGYTQMRHVREQKAGFQGDPGQRGVGSMDNFARCFGIWAPAVQGGMHRRIDIVVVTPLEW